MNNEQQLRDFIKMHKIHLKGISSSGYTWVQLADMFKILPEGTPKQKGDKVRGIAKRMSPVNKALKKHPDGIYIVLGCVHAPFHVKPFWYAMLNLLSTLSITGLILNGDFIDLVSLSSHDKGKIPVKNVTLGWEYEQSNICLDELDNLLGSEIIKHYIYGNHEDRYLRYMKNPDSYKLGGAVKSPTEALKLSDRGYLVYEDWKMDEVQLGDLFVYHGEATSKHVCHAELNTHKKSVMFAHTHRIQSYHEGMHKAYNIGCMADFKDNPVFNYASKGMKKKWNNGFAIVTLVNGKHSVEQIIWNKDHFIYGGKVYKA